MGSSQGDLLQNMPAKNTEEAVPTSAGGPDLTLAQDWPHFPESSGPQLYTMIVCNSRKTLMYLHNLHMLQGLNELSLQVYFR